MSKVVPELAKQVHETKQKSWRALLRDRLIVVVPASLIFILTLVLVSLIPKQDVESALEWAQGNQPQSCIYFSLFMALWITCLLSKSIFSIAAGYVFDSFWVALAVTVSGMMLGLALTILVVRTILSWSGLRSRLRDYMVENYLEIHVLSRLLKTEPFRAIFLIKMSLLPTWLKSYSLAVLDAPMGTHLFVQLLSGTLYSCLFVYFGSVSSSLAEIVSGKAPFSWIKVLPNIIGTFLSFCTFWYIRVRVKSAIEQVVKEQVEQKD